MRFHGSLTEESQISIFSRVRSVEMSEAAVSILTIQIACDRPFFASIGDVALDGKSSLLTIDLPSGPHELVWAVLAGAGGDFKATIREGARTVCSVSEWKIPAGAGWCGDLATFSV